MDSATSPLAAAEARSRVTERTPGLRSPRATLDEALVADVRAGLTPAQMVERKLHSLLASKALPVSHLMTAARRGRGHAPVLQ